MGKRIRAQRKGKGTPSFSVPSHRFKADLQHVLPPEGGALHGIVEDIVHDPARNAPIALVRLENNVQRYVLIPEGIGVGEKIGWGVCEARVGNTLPLSMIPEGTEVCNVELRPRDGGKLVRASGTYAIVFAHEGDKVALRLPSGQIKRVDSRCMATIGVVAGGGRIEKPFVKAGKKFYKMRMKSTVWPRTRGVAMNPVDHPFGGGRHQHTGKPKTVSRGAPPGRKVGSISARRTGRKK